MFVEKNQIGYLSNIFCFFKGSCVRASAADAQSRAGHGMADDKLVERLADQGRPHGAQLARQGRHRHGPGLRREAPAGGQVAARHPDRVHHSPHDGHTAFCHYHRPGSAGKKDASPERFCVFVFRPVFIENGVTFPWNSF